MCLSVEEMIVKLWYGTYREQVQEVEVTLEQSENLL